MLRKAALTLAGTAVVALGSAGVASAAVTFDSDTGVGFVGKGDVQLAFGWNNTQLQKNAPGVAFSSSQEASQALSQSGTQSGSQVVTQSASQEVSCTVETRRHTFSRSGERDGERSGTREGTRDGIRSGTLAGTLSSSIAYDARVKNQITGFNLKGYSTTPAFTATGSNEFGAWEFGDYTFGDATLGDVTWGEWQSDTNGTPEVCLGNNPGITDLENVTTYGNIAEGAITDHAIDAGAVSYGAVTATGAAQVFATHNSATKLLP